MVDLPLPEVRTKDQLLDDFGGGQPEQLKLRNFVETMFTTGIASPESTQAEVEAGTENAGRVSSRRAKQASQKWAPVFGTRALAAANLPVTAPDWMQLAGTSAVGSGPGLWLKKVGSEPAHDGKFQDAGGTWYEFTETRVKLSWFLTGANTNVQAFNAAAAFLKALGAGASGGVIDLEGKTWTFFTGSLLVNCSNVTIDARGARIQMGFAAPGIVFGDAVATIKELHIIGGDWSHGGTQPLIQTRRVRNLHLMGMYSENLYQLMEWGVAADGTAGACSGLIILDCEFNQRNAAEATHLIDVQNSVGGLFWVGSKAEGPTNDDGVLTGFGVDAAAFFFSAANPNTRFDYADIVSGIVKGYNAGIHVPSYRVVNIDLGPGFRIDDTATAGIILGSDSIAGQGIESWDIQCYFGGLNICTQHILLVPNAISFENIYINIRCIRGVGEALRIVPVGVGSIQNLNVRRIQSYDWQPADVGKRLVYVEGDVNGFIGGVSARLRAAHGVTPNYIVDDSTPATAELAFGRVTAEFTPAGGYISRTNYGNTALRLGETGADGFPDDTIKVVLAVDGTVVIPKNRYLKAIYMRNVTANAVTGGIKIGTTSGATDVVAAQAVGANAFLRVTDADVLIKGWNAAQTLFIQDVTAWNSANVVFTFETVLLT